jgi:hypothetical protein
VVSSAETPAGRKQLAALLVCFTTRKGAAKARRPLEARLRASGHTLVDTTILQVDGKHKASVHAPRRVVMGAAISMATWGVFGLLTGGVSSLIASALIGAVLGGVMAYREGHHTTDAQLAGSASNSPLTRLPD